MFFSPAFAQENDSLATDLPTVFVQSTYASDVFEQELNEDSAPQSISTTLNQQTGLFSRTLGAGTSVSTGVRGGNANQLAILWNGLHIVNPMLGQADISLLTPFSYQTIHIDKGGNAAQNGGMAGTIRLSSKSNQIDSNLLNAWLQFGSFRQQMQAIKVSLSPKNITFQTKLYHEAAENDFPYTLSDNIKGHLSNAAHRNYALYQDIYGALSKNLSFGLHFWHQNSFREIPPSIQQVRSEASQQDLATRMTGNIAWQQGNWKARLITGYTHDHLDYNDPLNSLQSPNTYQSVQNNLRLAYQHKDQFFSIMLASKLFYGEANNYWNKQQQHNFLGQFKHQWRAARWSGHHGISISAQNNHAPLLPFASLQYKTPLGTTIAMRSERQFRFPSLNDLFWSPGGNPNLKPESGWYTEISLLQEPKSSAWQFQQTLFHRTAKDQILWARQPNQSFWSPQNLSQTQTLGFETAFRIQLKLNNNWLISTRHQYAFTHAVALESLEALAIPKGQQRWYTPKHQISSQIGLSWQEKLDLEYQHLYQDNVTGPFGGLPAQHSGQLNIKYSAQKLHTTIHFLILNIWDSLLFTQENRIAPGRHYQLSMHYKLKKI